MTISGEDISRVTTLLKMRPRGMSIAAIAKELHMNRNSVAKYLDLLMANGAVELTRLGPAKLYFTAPRVPVSGMINLSSDYFIMLDANLRILYVNNNVLTFEERTRPEVLQKRLEELGFALVADEAIGKYLHSTGRDEIFQREVEVRKGEETFHFRVKIIPTVYENGTQGITILATDITTETEQRKALEKNEESFRSVVLTAPGIILTVSREGKILYANRGSGEFSAEDVIGRPLVEFVPPDQQDIIRDHLEKTFTTGQPTTYEVLGYGPGGAGSAWYESHLGPVFQDGKVIAATLISLDITDKKKVLTALEESEARYRAVVEDQTEMICRFYPDGTHSFVNDAYCRYFGKKREDLIGHRFIPCIPDEDRKKVAALLDSLTPEKPVGSIEHQIIMPDGDVQWQRWIDRAIFDDTGRLVEYQSVGRDITDKKHALDLARAQFQSFPIPTYILRRRGDELIASDYNEASFLETRGMVARMIGRPVRDLFREYPSILANLECCLAEKTTIEQEIRYKYSATDKERDLIIRYAYLPPDGVLVYGTDITDRKRMEEALRASEEQFREMAETSPFPISIINNDGRYRYLNRRFIELFGYTLDDVPNGHRWFEQAFPDPDLRRKAVAAWKGDLAGSRPGMVRPRQFPVQCRNGKTRDIIFRPVTMRDGTQYLTYEDVTERLHTLDSLRQSEARFRHLFNSMRCCFILVDPVLDGKGIPVDLTLLEVNAAMERLSGRIREDLLGQQLRELFPKTPPELIEAIGGVALTGNPRKLSIYHPDLNRTLKIRAYSPWKGQCALIFRVVDPALEMMPPGESPPPAISRDHRSP